MIFSLEEDHQHNNNNELSTSMTNLSPTPISGGPGGGGMVGKHQSSLPMNKYRNHKPTTASTQSIGSKFNFPRQVSGLSIVSLSLFLCLCVK